MRYVLLAWGIGLLVLPVSSPGAEPLLSRQKVFGGSTNELLLSVEATSDGGYLLGGQSDSLPSGDKTAPSYGRMDYWVVRLDDQGQVLWDRSFGGSEDDFFEVLLQTSDGGVLVAGTSLSDTNGNKHSPGYGFRDLWVIRLDADGNTLWERSYGGDASDLLVDAILTPDDGFVFLAQSLSTASGTKTSINYGIWDYWVVRVDALGNPIWDRTFGGERSDFAYAIAANTNGFLVGGESRSGVSGSKTLPAFGFFSADYWLVSLDTNGNQVSEHVFGGFGDDVLLDIQFMADGGYLLGGASESPMGGNKTSTNYGRFDFWVVRTDAAGNALWDQSYGSSGNEVLRNMIEKDNGELLLGGWADRPIADGSKTTVGFGTNDFWLVGADDSGAQQWDQTFGGSSIDVMVDIEPVETNRWILGGYSFSPNDGNKTEANLGGADFWIIEIDDSGLPPATPPILEVLAAAPGTGHFRFKLIGQDTRTYVSESSTDAANWSPFSTNTLSGTEVIIEDTGSSGFTQRFYRSYVLP